MLFKCSLEAKTGAAAKLFCVKTAEQMPFSFNQLKRLDQSIESVDVLQKGKFDKFGQAYEFGDEFAGLFGFRTVAVNPDRTLKFKVADYQRGVRESRQLFTREALRGGPIEPREIVDAYINANRALFDVRKNFKLDLDAARTLGITQSGFNSATDRLSGVEVGAINNNIFRPINISAEIQQAFAENAAKIGEEKSISFGSPSGVPSAKTCRNRALSSSVLSKVLYSPSSF